MLVLCQGVITLSRRMAPTAKSPAKALRGAAAAARARAQQQQQQEDDQEQETASSPAPAPASPAGAAAAAEEKDEEEEAGGYELGELASEACSPVKGAAAGAATSNPWHLLWATTAACPAWEQRPLQDPMLEGERALHDLVRGTLAHRSIRHVITFLCGCCYCLCCTSRGLSHDISDHASGPAIVPALLAHLGPEGSLDGDGAHRIR